MLAQAFFTASKISTRNISPKMAALMSTSSHSGLDPFIGKYYFNDDPSYNFVATEKFQTDQEKLDTLAKFPNIRNPSVNPNQPALKIVMKTNGGRGPGLFMHDVLYNISIEEREGGKLLVMNCMTGDMQMEESGRVSMMQAKGKTVITLVKQSGIASMDIGGGFGKEKWVMNPKNQ